MKGNEAVIASLKEAAAIEAALATQYRLDKRQLKRWGLSGIAKKIGGFYDDAEDWLNWFVDRLLLFNQKGDYAGGRAVNRSTVADTLQKALDAEEALQKRFNEMAIEAMKASDDNTRNHLEHAIKAHEDHIEWLERQLALIATLGLKEYIAEHI
jgi:bacterioferritin